MLERFLLNYVKTVEWICMGMEIEREIEIERDIE